MKIKIRRRLGGTKEAVTKDEVQDASTLSFRDIRCILKLEILVWSPVAKGTWLSVEESQEA
ncbi:hypothetical protein KI387_025295, partial [Taxus chinensis]